jgi:hypothetical protein
LFSYLDLKDWILVSHGVWFKRYDIVDPKLFVVDEEKVNARAIFWTMISGSSQTYTRASYSLLEQALTL